MSRIITNKNTYQLFDDIAILKNTFPSLEIQVMAYSSLINEIGIDKFSSLLINSNVSYILSPDADKELIAKLDDSILGSGISVIRFAPYIINNENVNTLNNSTGYIFQRSTDAKKKTEMT